jgi:hypothetical protein
MKFNNDVGGLRVYSKLSAAQMSSRYVRCAPNAVGARSRDHRAERSPVPGIYFWPLIGRQHAPSSTNGHAARHSALPRERFRLLTQVRH